MEEDSKQMDESAGDELPTIDMSGFAGTFHLGRAPVHRRRRRRRPPAVSDSSVESVPLPPAPHSSPFLCSIFYPPPTVPPLPGMIRLLHRPPHSFANSILMSKYYQRDLSLTEWIREFETVRETMLTGSALIRVTYPPDFVDHLESLFYTNQRQRWLARIVLQRWRRRVWMTRTQCNIDMIDMEPVADNDAIFLTDTAHHQIFRFHRRDIFQNLISNICMSDDMFPCPRSPTNPWTNETLRLNQIIHLCQQLYLDFAKRGKATPVLLSAFHAARYDLRRFREENASLLSQHAISAYFKDIHDDNRDTIYDTMIQLISEARVSVSPASVRQWLRDAPPLTPKHREWLELIRDYTLYINLHVQIRPHWRSDYFIYQDVEELVSTTQFPEILSNRMRAIRDPARPQVLIPSELESILFPRQIFPASLLLASQPSVISISTLFGPTGATGPASTDPIDTETALARIRDALLRM
jgi:hypothetical protein